MLYLSHTNAEEIFEAVKTKFTGNELYPQICGTFHKIMRSFDFKAMDVDGAIPAKFIRDLFFIGAFSITLPEENGGIGGNLFHYCDIIAQAGRYSASVALMLADHLGSILCFREEGSHAPHLSIFNNLDSDPRIYGWGYTEGRNIKLVGRFSIPASFFTLVHDPACGSSPNRIILVSPDEALAETEKISGQLGYRSICMELLHVKYDKISTPVFLISENSDRIYRDSLFFREIGSCACSIGLAERAFSLAMSYSECRIQFKKKLNENELIRKKLVEMESDLFISKSLLFYLLALSHFNPGKAKRISGMVKRICARKAFIIANESMEIHGGNGYMEDYEIPRLFRDSKMNVFINSFEKNNHEITQDDLVSDSGEPIVLMDDMAGFQNEYNDTRRTCLSSLRDFHNASPSPIGDGLLLLDSITLYTCYLQYSRSDKQQLLNRYSRMIRRLAIGQKLSFDRKYSLNTVT